MKSLFFLLVSFLISLNTHAKQYYCPVKKPACEKYARVESVAVFVFKRTQEVEVAINRGEVVHRSTISTGMKIHGGTPSGIFYPSSRIYKTKNHCSSNKDYAKNGRLAPMPYAIHFHKGYAIHAGRVTGRPASHGCVRMNEPDAKKLYCLLTSHENWKRTMIVVQD